MSLKVKQPFGQAKDPTVIDEQLINGEITLPFNEVKYLSLSYKSKNSALEENIHSKKSVSNLYRYPEDSKPRRARPIGKASAG